MKFRKNKLLTTVSAVALTFAVGACSSSSDDDDMMSGGPPPVIDQMDPEAPDTVLTELQKAQKEAMDAETAAMTASDTATTAAAAAMAAVANHATIQTGATAAGLAYEAHTAAGNAMAAYLLAKEASGDAAEAEDVTAAVTARLAAEEASANAVKYAMTATEKAGEAETAAMAELMIVGKDKNVGGSSLNADDAARKETLNDQSTITGLMEDMNPETMVGPVTGVAFMPEDDGPDGADGMAYKQGVAGDVLTIGRTLDTSDDMARLMLVHSYAGTKTVKVYADGAVDPLTSIKAGTIQTMGSDLEDRSTDVFVPLKLVGTYYRAVGTGEVLTAAHQILKDAKPKQVYSYVIEAANEGDDDATVYVVSLGKNEFNDMGTMLPTYNYQVVDITADTGVRVGVDETVVEKQVTAKIPEATEYKHIHFGVWAALGAAAKDGTQELSDLGIGFVQSIGDGLTSIGGTSDDLPNSGSAKYNGNWAAAVQAADGDGNGPITLEHDTATLTADFGKATISADLTGLADLTGDIAGNTFSGTKAAVADNTYGLTDGADFTGTFRGGFYGASGAEAGGVFDFTSKDAEDGAFSGAFGGKK